MKFKLGDRIIYQEPHQRAFKGVIVNSYSSAAMPSLSLAGRYVIHWTHIPGGVTKTYSCEAVDEYSTLIINTDDVWQKVLNES